MEEQKKQKTHLDSSTPRPKRSNTNLSNLRLAPLSTSFLADTPSGPHTDSSYNTHHSSYIQGKSAPSTPGILGRSSSRRQLGGGLSRKLSLYDIEAPSYAAVEVNRDGVPLHALRTAEPGRGILKAKSEAALLVQRRLRPQLQTQLSLHSGGGARNHRRSQTSGVGIYRGNGEEGEDWLSRAAVTTHALLRESTGRSWHSAAVVADDVPSSDEEDEEAAALGRLSASAHRLHYADDELSPETPRYTSRWGSRFGSRAPSARNSRRGSRVDLLRTPTVGEAQEQGGGYFEQDFSSGRDDIVEPDFVDGGEGRDTTEEEVERLAMDRSFGLGGLVDRLVGWTLFSVDEDREATDVEEVEEDVGPRTMTASAAVRGIPQVQRTPVQDVQPEAQDEGGWHDAAWLLSLATKVIL